MYNKFNNIINTILFYIIHNFYYLPFLHLNEFTFPHFLYACPKLIAVMAQNAYFTYFIYFNCISDHLNLISMLKIKTN